MNYKVNRKVWQILWYNILDDMGYHTEEIENNTFLCRPYSWDDDYHDNSFHFWHKPSGFKLYWYKYPLRDSWCNMSITSDQFVDILYDCKNSLEEGKRCKVIHSVDDWWNSNSKDEKD